MPGRPSRRKALANENFLFTSDAATFVYGKADKVTKARLMARMREGAFGDVGQDEDEHYLFPIEALRAWCERHPSEARAKALPLSPLVRDERQRSVEEDPAWRRAVEDIERQRAEDRRRKRSG